MGARRTLGKLARTLALGAVTATVVAAPAVAGTGATPASTTGMLETIAEVTGARDLWACGYAGQGIDVALVDTGVAPVAGSGPIVNGPDLSLDVQAGQPAYVDAFGHGTHMASIINGRSQTGALSGACRYGKATGSTPRANGWWGVAPGARVVNVKVGAADGAVDVSQMLAAIDWVVQHRNTDGLNIKVLVLAYGVGSLSPASADALSHAVEVATRKGIVVVASSGNDGTTKTDLAFPARNSDVIAVGAVDMHGSANVLDWSVADFADRGTTERAVDLVVPGVAVDGLRVPGSVIDSLAPTTTGDRFVRGSGTSQSAAVVGGLAALLAQRYPTATPAQIKTMLKMATMRVRSNQSWSQGAGAVVAMGLLYTAPVSAASTPTATTGTAPIEADRADGTLAIDGVALTGEIDVQGNAWSGSAWAAAASAGTSWQGGSWMGHTFTGTGFASAGWRTAAWPSLWSGTKLAKADGPGGTWDGVRWNGLRWNGTTWSGLRWNGVRWNGTAWEGVRWNGVRWNMASVS